MVDIDVMQEGEETGNNLVADAFRCSSGSEYADDDDDRSGTKTSERVQELVMSMGSFAENFNNSSAATSVQVRETSVGASKVSTAEIEASVARLRQQRRAVARMKQTSARKDASIRELTAKNGDLETRLASSRKETAKATKHKKAIEKQRARLERELRDTKAAFETREIELMSKINKLVCSEKDLAKLKKQCSVALEGAASYRACVQKYRAELISNRDTLLASKEKWTSSKVKYKARISELKKERDCFAAQCTEWEGKANALALLNEEQRELLLEKEAETDACAERCGIMQSTINELEEDCEVLRGQIVDSEADMKREAAGVVGELKETQAQLIAALQTARAAELAADEARAFAKEERRERVAVQAELDRMQGELDRSARHIESIKETRHRAVEELETAARRNKALQSQIEEMADEMDELKRTLREEEASRKSTAGKRIELLNQFYQEEMMMQSALSSIDGDATTDVLPSAEEFDDDQPWVKGRLSDIAM